MNEQTKQKPIFYFSYEKLDSTFDPNNFRNFIKDIVCKKYSDKKCSEIDSNITVKIKNSMYLVTFNNILEYTDLIFDKEYFTWTPGLPEDY